MEIFKNVESHRKLKNTIKNDILAKHKNVIFPVIFGVIF